MKPDYNLEALNLRKRAVERAAKVVTLKLEKTRYLYNIEKEKRKSAAIKQLRVLLEYETRELDRAKAELREIAVKMILLEQEKQKQAKTRMKGIAVLLIFSLAFAGLLVQYGLHYYDAGVAPEFIVETADTSNAPNFSITDRFLAFLEKLGHYRSDNSLTGAVIGIPVGNCHEEITCVNQTTTHCVNETVQKCDAACVNETIESCSEQCLPNCVIEEINGKEREVCTTSCSTVCSTETVQNCGGCSEVMEEKCSSEIVEQCSTETVCDEPVESGVAAEIVEESPTVEIQPIEEAAEDISEELDIQPIEEEIPQDDVTGGAITIPELEEPELEVPVEGSAGELEVQPIEEESSELDVQPIIEEPVEEIPDISEPETQPIETIPPEQAEDEPEMPAEIVEEPIEDEEEVPPEVVEPEEKSFFASMIQSIKAALTPELDPLALSIIYTRLNTTFVTSGVAANLTAHVNTTEGLSKITYNWFRNGTSITKLNVPFEKINSTTTNNSRDYSGNKYNMNPLGGVTWNATGGYDGKGAYTLKGTAAQNLSIYNMSFPTTALSVAFWLLTNGSGDGIISYAPSDPENNEFLLFEQTNLAVYTNNGAVTTGVTGLSDGRWHHVVVTWRSSTGRIEVYKDGQLNYSQTTGSTAALNNTRRGCLTIGQDNDDYCGQYQAGQALIGTVDELLIFDRVINADQVFALWSNQSNTIIDREVVKGEKWTVEATPNDGSIDGAPRKDHYYIYQPVIHSLVLNSTNTSTNSSDVNITAYVVTADSDNDEVKVTYNWLVNNSPIAILNMPFEQVNFTGFNNSWDYSGLGNNGNETGGSGANWSATAGYDGKGAYSFNGLNNNNFITLSENGYWKNLCISGCTFSVWVTVGERGVGPELILSRGNTQSTFFEFSTGRTAGQGASLGVNFNGSISGNPSPRCDVSTTGGLVYNKGVSWNHIVGVYNLSHIAIYINGTQNILEPCPIYGLNATIWQNNSRVLIGARDNAGSTSNNFNGTIDELMVFNRSLTEAQIRALWLNQTNIIVAQETGRAENWSVQAFPNDGFTDGEFADGTIALSENVSVLNQKPTLILVVNSTNMSSNNTHVNITAYATASDNDSDPTKVIYNWRVNGTPVMVLNMPFEQVNGTSSNNIWDYSGLSHNGSVVGATWNATGGFDGKGAYQFDRVDDYIRINDSPYLKTTCTGGCTVAAWVYVRPTPTSFNRPWLVAKYDAGTATERFFALAMAQDSSERFTFSIGNGSTTCTATGGAYANNSWQHVVGRWNNSWVTIYVNGTQKAQNSCTFTSINSEAWKAGKEDLIIGANDDELPQNFFNGTIDEVLIFNRSLSLEEIQALWLNQTNIIVANETSRFENWTIEATPNDGYEDGIMQFNNISILNAKPTHSTPRLNTTDLTLNYTTVNLTAINLSTADIDSDIVKNIYNWIVNGTPIAVLNMPFEGINSTTSNNAWDYSGYGNNGSDISGPLWNASGGYDGKGAYMFDGFNDYIGFVDTVSLNINGSLTLVAWLKPRTDATQQEIIWHGSGGVDYDLRRLSTGELRAIVANASNTQLSATSTGDIIDNVWLHVAVTHNFNGSDNNLSLYINGVFNASARTQNFGKLRDSGRFELGNFFPTNNTGFNGTIDEVMVFNRSLSTEQIFALYQNKTELIVSEETSRGDVWSVQITPNDGFDDGQMLQSNSVTIRYNLLPVIDSLILNTTNMSSNKTEVNLTAYVNKSDPDIGHAVKVIYNWLVDSKPIAVLNMPFEGINSTASNNAWDYSGLGNNGSENNGALWNATGGYDGKGAYMFDGIDDYINVSNANYFKGSLCINGCTFSAWAKGVKSGVPRIIGRWQSTGDDRFFLFGFSSTQQLSLTINPDGGAFVSCTANSAAGQFLNNTYQHVVGVYNLTNTAVYINGTLAGTTACSFNNISVAQWADEEDTRIGADAIGNQWNGTIDEVMVFNRSLSAEQIRALYRNETNIIVAQETVRGENWTVQATPNDGLDDGIMDTSNNVTILNTKPIISPLVLNSTNPKANHTGTHLLAYPNSSDADNDSIKVIYNWLRDDTPIALLNMPFEKINGTDTDNAWDYSGYGHNGSVVGATWNVSGGYDGKGAYLFDDSGDYIELTAHLSRLEGLSAGTISLWYRSNDTTTNGDYLFSITDKDVSTDVMIFSVGSSTGAYADEGLNFVNIRGGVTVLSMFVREGETAYKNQQWHHFAVVTGDGDNRVYIDGVRKPITFGAGSAATKEFSNINNPDKSFIGRYHVGGTAFDSAGVRDEVLIFNRSLSEEQILALYNNRTDKIVSRELRIGENWTVEATPNDGQEDGVMVTSNNVTILANTLPSITSLILNTTNTSSNKTEVNLTAYADYTDSNNDSVKIIYNWLRDGTPMTFLNMPFERINDTNTNNAKDYSLNSNNGTISGATWVEDAGYDGKGAYKFDGVNDYIASVGNVSDFVFMQNTGNFTIEAWIKFDNYAANSLQVIAGNTPTTAEKGFLFAYENRTGSLGHNHLTLALYRGVAGTYTVWANSSDFKIIDNDWHHVAAVGNYTNVLFYVDGVYDTGSKGDIINLPTGNANRVLDIGRYNGATPAGYFNGTIDELRIWDRTLPADQIFAIFNNRTNLIVSNLTTAGENWTVDATPNDGVDDGATVRSNQVIISSGANTLPPAPVLLTPPTANTTTNRTPAFTWNNSVDADGSTVTYRLEIDDNPAFNNLEVNVSDIANSTADNTTYLITTELAVDTTYFWKVFAYDGTEFGTNSTVFNFTLQSFLAIDIINNAVAFGTLNNGQNVSTPADATPFRAENSGNIVANVTLTATPLFGMVSLNQPFYAFNITANETGAFNYTQSSTNWTFFNSSSPFPHVWNLDWHLASNDFITHVNVSVPGNESGGLKSSIVTFTIEG